jgi:hypothetical protein
MTNPKKTRNRRPAPSLPTSLPAIRPRVAGLDVGSSQHWVCGPAREDGQPNVRVFGTTTDQLNALADWLPTQGVESVAMESTHVYWIPIYELPRVKRHRGPARQRPPASQRPGAEDRLQ